MYASRSQRVKTEKRDARTLGDALQLGAHRVIHRASTARAITGSAGGWRLITLIAK